MKKTIFKVASVSITSILLLSSCLGDGTGQKVERKGEMSFINLSPEGGTKYAITASGLPITSAEIKGGSFDVGEVYLLDYKWSTDSGSDFEGIQNADDVRSSDDGSRLPQEKYNNNTKEDQLINLTPISQLAVQLFLPASYNLLNFGERWIFMYTSKRREHDRMRLVAFYDVSKQKDVDSQGEPVELKEGQYIIDLRLEKFIPSDDESEKLVDVSRPGVIDFTDLRRRLENELGIDTSNAERERKNVQFKFRYTREIKDKDPEVSTIGTFVNKIDPSLSVPVFFMSL